jgi:hypothetical protein
MLLLHHRPLAAPRLVMYERSCKQTQSSVIFLLLLTGSPLLLLLLLCRRPLAAPLLVMHS